MATWFDDAVMRPEVAGLFGALLGLINAPGSSTRERAFNFGAGIGVAWFVAPAMSHYLSVDQNNGKMAVAFVVGLVGMNLAAKVISYAKVMEVSDIPGLKWLRKEAPEGDQK